MPMPAVSGLFGRAFQALGDALGHRAAKLLALFDRGFAAHPVFAHAGQVVLRRLEGPVGLGLLALGGGQGVGGLAPGHLGGFLLG